MELACGVVAVNRVASETLRGDVVIGIVGSIKKVPGVGVPIGGIVRAPWQRKKKEKIEGEICELSKLSRPAPEIRRFFAKTMHEPHMWRPFLALFRGGMDGISLSMIGWVRAAGLVWVGSHWKF